MANEKHLQVARAGKNAWNGWRRENPDEPADFSGTNFTTQENRKISFAGFELGNGTNFSNVEFGDTPESYQRDWEKAVLNDKSPQGGAVFAGAIFGEDTDFSEAVFGRHANFVGTRFGNSAQFVRSAFDNSANFERSTFGSNARFLGAIFGNFARFQNSSFGPYAKFEHVAFGSLSSFARATFQANAEFQGVSFETRPRFDNAIFFGKSVFAATHKKAFNQAHSAQFKTVPNSGIGHIWSMLDTANPTSFGDISFSGVKFFGEADFTGRSFNGRADFSHVRFKQPPNFRGTEDQNNFDWTGASFGFRGKVGSVSTPGWTTDTETATKLRRLRKIASEIHAHDAERNLFILERMAEMGIGWSDWWQRSDQPGTKGLLVHLFGWGRILITTILMAIYWMSSNCGRSIVMPLFWLGISLFGFGYWYASHVAGAIEGKIYDALATFTLANAIPFVGSSRQATIIAVKTLFGNSMPDAVYGITLFQGLTSVLLLFLVGLALRAHFKVR